MGIGQRIKTRREYLKMSVDDLARDIGKNRATVYRYENGDIESLPTSILEPLCLALYTTPDYLMGWSDEPDKDFYNYVNGIRDIPNDFLPNLSVEERMKRFMELKSKESISTIYSNEITELTSAQDALKFILEQPIFASNIGYDPKKMTDEQLIKLANRILRFARMEVEDIEYVDLDELDALDNED